MKTYLKPFLIFGAMLLLVVMISWFAFPGWRAQPGGMWLLIGAAVVGVVAIAKDVLDIAKTWQDINTPSTPETAEATPPTQQKQIVRGSKRVRQKGQPGGGIQEQEVNASEDVSQEMG